MRVQLEEFADFLDRQAGVVSRAQLLAAGAAQHDLERWVRRNELRRLMPGVYLAHTGPPAWHQQAWAAVLWAEPAALARNSAVRAVGGRVTPLPGNGQTLHLLVAAGRHRVVPPGVILHCTRSLNTAVLWAASPPRQREEGAALDQAVAHLNSDSPNRHLNAVAVLTEPIQARRTGPLRCDRWPVDHSAGLGPGSGPTVHHRWQSRRAVGQIGMDRHAGRMSTWLPGSGRIPAFGRLKRVELDSGAVSTYQVRANGTNKRPRQQPT